MTKILFVLQDVSKGDFILTATTAEGLEKKIMTAYWNKKGVQSKDSTYEVKDYLKGKIKVKVTIEPLEEK